MSRADDSTWGDRLEAWRLSYYKLQRDENAAFRRRSEGEEHVRILRKQLKDAEEAFAASDAKAQELRRKDEEMLRDGEKEGFRP